MRIPLVTLILCPSPVACAVFVNGALMGQTAPDEPLPMPLSATGDYFLTLAPLSGDHLSLTRRISLQEGRPCAPLAEDVALYSWPEGLLELEMTLPRPQAPKKAAYPYLLTRLALANGRSAALYVENGLCLVVEEGWRVLYGTRLNDGERGSLVQQNGLLMALAEKTDREDAVLVALTPDFQEAFRLTGDSVEVTPTAAQSITRLPTLLGHQRRERCLLTPRQPRQEPPVFGFFTHTFTPPQEQVQIAQCLVEAVQHGFFTEARQYLSADLADQLSDKELKEFFFGCSGVRPCPRKELCGREKDTAALGLIFPKSGGSYQVRPFLFHFCGGLVDDVHDEEEQDV